jgi:hypothetical protein
MTLIESEEEEMLGAAVAAEPDSVSRGATKPPTYFRATNHTKPG